MGKDVESPHMDRVKEAGLQWNRVGIPTLSSSPHAVTGLDASQPSLLIAPLPGGATLQVTASELRCISPITADGVGKR